MQHLIDQTKALVEKFPPDTPVKVLASINPDCIGVVIGYRVYSRAHIEKPSEMRLIVDIPGDTWILSTQEVEPIEK